MLDEAAAHLAALGVTQWPPSFLREWIERELDAGEMWLAEVADEPVGTFSVSWSDRLWADDGAAGYLHRLAVRRRASGLGPWLLDRAADIVRENGRGLLRLDCGADNPVLRAYYERAGFRHVDDQGVPVEQLRWSAGPIVVSRYERTLH